MIIVRLLNSLWAYCQHCMTRQDFVSVDGAWVCERCGKPLSSQSD
jgi:hypothetical protein